MSSMNESEVFQNKGAVINLSEQLPLMLACGTFPTRTIICLCQMTYINCFEEITMTPAVYVKYSSSALKSY